MDNSGRWHTEPSSQMRDLVGELSGQPKQHIQRPVIEIGIGEKVIILKDDGAFLLGVFEKAEDNKVTIGPIDSGVAAPYFETAERVRLTRSTGEHVKAMVWDNRGGKIVLRTLPVGGGDAD